MEQAIKQEFENLAVAIQKGFAQVDARFEQVDKRFGQVDVRLNGIDMRLNGIDMRLDGVESRLGAVEHEVSGIRKDMVYRHEFEDLAARTKYVERKILRAASKKEVMRP